MFKEVLILLVLILGAFNSNGCAVTDLGSNHDDYTTEDYNVKKVETNEDNDETGVTTEGDDSSDSE